MTEIPARTASSASATACSPGTDTSARSAPDRRIAAAERPGGRRLAEAAGAACRRAALGERGLERSLTGGDAGLVAPDRDDEVVRRRVRHVEAHAADDLEVELGRHRDLGGLDPGGGGDGARDLHEGHGVEVGAGSQLDVVSHGGLLRGGVVGRGIGRASTARSAPLTPESRSRPDECPMASTRSDEVA